VKKCEFRVQPSFPKNHARKVPGRRKEQENYPAYEVHKVVVRTSCFLEPRCYKDLELRWYKDLEPRSYKDLGKEATTAEFIVQFQSVYYHPQAV